MSDLEIHNTDRQLHEALEGLDHIYDAYEAGDYDGMTDRFNADLRSICNQIERLERKLALIELRKY
jgi:hypothetical protein